jgi:TfoX/Sxy family transcriptional regulator of competence genes
MSSTKEFVDYIAEQLQNAGLISTRKMFGEYALYCNEKVVGLICDNRLFIKQTDGGRNFIGIENIVEECAYPGAKPSLLIEDKIDDSVWLTELIKITVNELPEKKPKKKKGSKLQGGASC